MVIIYTGDGKGKTSAAAGSALRMAGSGKKVLFTQFLKDGSSGECLAFRDIWQVELLLPEQSFGFTFQMDGDTRQRAKDYYAAYWQKIKDMAQTEAYAMVVLDEIIGAINSGLADAQDVLNYIKRYRDRTEIVLTGRSPAKELLAQADYITDMQKIRHPFDKGIPARHGIEK